jgi:hypothetical protein
VNVDSVPQPWPALVVEYIEPELLAIDLEKGKSTETSPLAQCVGVLASVGVAPLRTRLVVTGDFVQAVRDRANPGTLGSARHRSFA